MFVDPPQIAPPQGHAVTVEKFQDLDRDLAAILDLVAELRGGELRVRRLPCKIADDVHHLGDCAAQEEMVMRHLVDLDQDGRAA